MNEPRFGTTTVNMTNLLKGLIKDYRTETILKEYLQNADDAGATELVVTYDKQTHKLLKGTIFESISYPSLLLSNNAIFEKRNFESILRLYDEDKIEDARSTGRFGVGFRSSYSITDYPTFLSSGKVIWLDDLQETICKGKPSNHAIWEEESFLSIKNWLDTFKVGGDNKTIFRLPLRSEKNAEKSKLSNEIFSFDKFLNWSNEWSLNAKDLLFLRNINKLILQEITEDGEKIVHLEIKTKNYREIEKIKNSINSRFALKALDTCNQWLNSKDKLPLFQYIHQFRIRYFSPKENKLIENIENWAVVNGLFRGIDNNLLKKSKEALLVKSNVLPWVGVALQVDSNNFPLSTQSGKWYTFLPLFDSGYSTLLHGWFDLNNGRTKLTYTSKQTDDYIETLKNWNEELLKQGLGLAWSKLLKLIKNEKNIPLYYNLWAKKEKNTTIHTDLENSLIIGFYQEISKLKCFYTTYQNKQEWLSPTDTIFIFEEQDNTILLKSFKEHFKIITPNPPKWIIQNFKKIGINIQKITPKYVRGYLKQEQKNINFPIPLNEIPIKMLSKKEWFLEVLKYSAEKGEDYSSVEALPLELSEDNYISLIGESNILFDKTINNEFLQNNLSLILNKNLVDSIEENNKLPATWLMPTLKNFITIIFENVDSFKLTKEWIENIFKFIGEQSKPDVMEAKELLWQFPIVYRDDKKWVNLKSDIENKSPVLVENKNDIVYLKTIGMNIVHLEYVNIYHPILKYDGFITQLTSETLVKYILSLDEFSFFEDKGIRDFLIDLLAQDSSWYKRLTPNQHKKFSSIKFIPTDSEELYTIKSKDELFLPTNFTPPNIRNLGKKYTLVKDVIDKKTYSMYQALGIEEQTLKNYIGKVIIPFIEKNLFPQDTILAFEWLLEQWNENQNLIDSNLLKKFKIIPTENGDVKKIKEVYNPFIYVPEILSDIYNPYRVSKNVEKIWEKFLNSLGSSDKIFPKHILSKVLEIEKNKNKDDAHELLKFIIEDIQEKKNNNFENVKIGDEFLLKIISKHYWFPVDENKHYLLPPNKDFHPFMSSMELALPSDIKIIGSIRYTLTKDIKLTRDTAQKLGFLTKLKDNEVFNNFRKLVSYIPNQVEEEKQILEYVIEFYKYLGRSNIQNIPNDIKNKSILIKGQWFSSNRVFEKGVKLRKVISWKFIVSQEMDNKSKQELKEGLKKLGIKEKPNVSLYIELLNELSQNIKLQNENLDEAKILLGQIKKQENIEEVRKLTTLPLLTTEDKLVDFNNLYINDLPSYNNAKDKNRTIAFCHIDYEDFAKKLGVKSLKEATQSSVNKKETIELEELTPPIIQFIKSEIFYNAMSRIFYNEDKEINNDILPKKIVFVRKLIINYFINDEYLFKDEFSTAYSKDNKLYLLDQRDEEDMNESIAQYISKNQNLTSESLLLIIRILRLKDENNIKDFLDNKHIKLLGKENTNIEEENIIFDDTREIDNIKQKELDDYFHAKFEDFRQSLYIWCIENSQEKEFLTLLYKYEKHNIIIYIDNNHFSIDDIFSNYIRNNFNFLINYNTKKIDIDKILEKNKSQIDETKIENNTEYRSLLYFDNKLDEVKQYIKESASRFTINSKTIKEEISNTKDNIGTANIKTSSIVNKKKSSLSPTKHSSTQDKKKKDKGEEAEVKVFKFLKKHFNNVMKASEIADSYGYDIRYEDKNGKFKYVEIKKDSNNRFFITKNELEFGRKHKTSYEIFIVKDDILYKVPRKDFNKLDISPIKYEVKYSLINTIKKED